VPRVNLGIAIAVVGLSALVSILGYEHFTPQLQGGNLRHAIAIHDYAGVESILRSHSSLGMDELDGNSGTALSLAVEIGDARMVELILKYPCDLNYLSPSNGTPLQNASLYGRTEIVRMLLKAGADPNCEGTGRNSTGFPLNYACSGGNFEIVELLIRAGAKIDAKDSQDRRGTPLLDALGPVPEKWQEREQIVKFLLDKGADLNVALPPSMQNESLLFWARRWQVPENIIQMLQSHGAK